MSRPSATGVVVAGGRSTRFGDREKALATLGGEPMLRHVVAAVGDVTGEVVVNCRADQRGPFEAALSDLEVPVRFAVDERPDEGPLSGLAAGLAAVETEVAVVVACDMPLVTPELFGALLDGIGERPDAEAAVPRTDGGPEPLCAAYRTAPALGAARAALDDGSRSLRALLTRLDVRWLDVGEADLDAAGLRSVDTQAALERERERF
ncbi:molybdenum cofactor guanylyltransferase [Haloarcula litorea]|uniref:molybdenum cofactor guanylyltransferase n=1 Tax=Haloarcula litorea TaxID=3032579 RepID=UPI0023E7F8EC|nr:molybdenum cofactor guanylyltransferase [Halomicroarcula sp. GDY20]